MIKGDKEISEEKVSEFKSAFREKDKDNDNRVDVSELADLARALNQSPSQDQIFKWSKQIDPKNTGKFDLDTFLKLMSKQYKEPETEDELIECIQSIFKPKQKTLTIKEFKNVMMNIGQKLNEEEVKELFKELKLEKESSFNYEQFIKAILTR